MEKPSHPRRRQLGSLCPEITERSSREILGSAQVCDLVYRWEEKGKPDGLKAKVGPGDLGPVLLIGDENPEWIEELSSRQRYTAAVVIHRHTAFDRAKGI